AVRAGSVPPLVDAPMSIQEFVEALERELRSHRVAFGRWQLLAFVAGAWPWARENPDVGRWAREFCEAGAVGWRRGGGGGGGGAGRRAGGPRREEKGRKKRGCGGGGGRGGGADPVRPARAPAGGPRRTRLGRRPPPARQYAPEVLKRRRGPASPTGRRRTG